ncbi:MAG: tetratricopeptide repeat protein [Bacteroidia bacterium]|nr:tetratricopeptide repeat protein [Bacteroidia bacterium]
MHRFFTYILLLPGIMLHLSARPSQDTLSTRDKVEITYRAEKLIKEYESLLNAIASSDLYDSEIKALIENSYAETANRLFFSDKAIIEDDINPANADHQKVRDAEVVRYLRDLDLSYRKSEDPTISISNVRSSRVFEENDKVYVQVYFESSFNGAHKTIQQPYRPTRRVAQIQAIKVDNQWQLLISSITFFNPDVPLLTADYGKEIGTQLKALTSEGDTLSLMQRELLRQQQDILNQIREDVARLADKEEQQKTENSLQLVQEGDDAFARQDYEAALVAYQEAQQIKYTPETFRKIADIRKEMAAQAQRQQKVQLQYADWTQKGRYAWRVKEYETAVQAYKNALKIKPQADSVQQYIRDLERTTIEMARLMLKYQQGDYNGAIKDLTKAIKDNPAQADLYLLRGRCYEQLDKPKQALEEYNEALKRYPDFPEAYRLRAALYEKTGQIPLADADYAMAISIWDQDPLLYLTRARLRYAQKNLSDAIADLGMAISLDSTRAEWYLERAEWQEAAGQPDKALDDYSRAISLSSGKPGAWYKRGMYHIRANHIQQAARDFLRAKEAGLDPGLWQKVEELAQQYYNEGTQQVVAQQYRAALTPFTHAVTLRPDFAEAYFARAGAHEQLQSYGAALDDYHEAVTANPDYFNAWYRRGVLRVKLNNYAEAVPDFEQAVRIQPGFALGWIELGKSLAAFQSWKRALEAYQRALEIDNTLAAVHMEAGRMRFYLKDTRNAAAALDQAIKLQPEFPEALLLRAQIMLATGEPAKALADCNEALKLRKEYAPALYERGNAQMALAQPAKASADYAAALKLDYRHAGVYLQRARAYAATGGYSSAVADFETAFELSDSVRTAAVYAEAGLSAIDAGKWEKARSFMDQSLSQDPTQPLAAYGMACILAIRGPQAEAMTWLEKAFASGEFTAAQIKKDKRLTPLKKDPAYKALVKKYLS